MHKSKIQNAMDMYPPSVTALVRPTDATIAACSMLNAPIRRRYTIPMIVQVIR